MEKTIPNPYLNRELLAYVVNSEVSPNGREQILSLQKRISDKFGKIIWTPPPERLHITLMDWLAPLVDYDRPKDEIFEEIFQEYDKAVTEAVKGIGPININFNFIGASPEAIYIKGQDDGQYEHIRQTFLQKVELLPNTKKPAQIIHSTIARYLDETDLEPIKDFVESLDVGFKETVRSFRLLRTNDTVMK